jgi:hypothetical protein
VVIDDTDVVSVVVGYRYPPNPPYLKWPDVSWAHGFCSSESDAANAAPA